MAEAKRDQNFVTSLLAVSNVDGITPVVVYADPVTHRLLVDLGGSSGVNYETPVGAIDGSNVTFTVSNTPKAIILRNSVYFENQGYTLSGLTITVNGDLVPQTNDSFKSQY